MNRFLLQLHTDGDKVSATLRTSSGLVISHSHSEFGDDSASAKFKSRGNLSTKELEGLGQELADIACPGPIRDALLRLMAGERMGLALCPSEDLQGLPWELLHLGGSFLALNPSVRLSRYIEGQRRLEPQGSFKLLVAFADPQSARYRKLEKAEDEFAAVCGALSDSSLQLVRLPHATAGSLARTLTASRFDGFHFTGHGDLRPSGGLLILEGGSPNETSEILGDDLVKKLGSVGVGFVVLSGCDTSGSSSTIGLQLARAGIPIVIGMQAPISDTVAHLFVRTLYAAILQRLSIEEAVFEARTAISGAGQDWATPVLMTGSPSVAILGDVAQAAPIKTNLPKPLTSFIGRRKEIEHCVDLLSRERCVTLLGSGGIGKTRLSIEVGRKVAPFFEHGVWQIRLEAVEANEEIWETVGQVFGIRAGANEAIRQRTMDFLGDRQLLLVLDNCEHVIESCRDVARTILGHCPMVKVLATSREIFGAGLDSVVRIPSLSFPKEQDQDQDQAKSSLLAEPLMGSYEAVELLVVRAKNADSRFAASNANVFAFSKVAKRLDGIPLALELAASRVRALAPVQILERLSRDLAWLDLENPGAVPRHKTLRATIEWSYRLLSVSEQSLFNRLGVFVGSFSLEGAEGVAAFGGVDVLQGLLSLVDKSLVVAEPYGDRMRYRLLDTCRHYALEKLGDSGEANVARDRHLAFMCEFAGEAFKGMFVSMEAQSRWFADFVEEHDNCLAALNWVIDGDGDPVSAGNMAKSLFHYWVSTCSFELSRRCISEIAQRLPSKQEALRIELQTLAGVSAVYGGDPAGIEQVKSAWELAGSHYPEVAYGTVAIWLGECAYMAGDLDLAARIYDWILVERKNRGSDPGTAQLMSAVLHAEAGDLELAETELKTFRQAREGKKDQRSVGYALCHLGHIALRKGSNDAPTFFGEGLRRLVSVQDKGALAEFLPISSQIFLPDRPEMAAVIQGFAEKLLEENGSSVDRLAVKRGAEVRDRTRSMIPDLYNRYRRDGRTMTIELVMDMY